MMNFKIIFYRGRKVMFEIYRFRNMTNHDQMAMFKHNKFMLVVLLCMFNISCSSESGSISSDHDPFLEWVIQELPEKIVINEHVLQSQPGISPGAKLMLNNKKMVISDNSRSAISLFSETGELLDETGRNGRGPGEFETINDIQIGPDGYLYVLDLNLMRVTSFRVNDTFEYLNTYSLTRTMDMQLSKIIHGDSGMYAVFNKIEDFSTGKNANQLYSLNDDFTIRNHLLDFPGNEKFEMLPGVFTDHLVGLKMHWDVAGDEFYYISSHDFEITKYNLVSGEELTRKIFDKGPVERVMTPVQLSLLEKRFEPILLRNPSFGETLKDSDVLPYFRKFSIHENYFLFTILNLDGESGVVLIYDMDTDEVFYIQAPHYFTPFAIHDSRLIGIDYTSQDSRPLLALEFQATE